MPRHHAARVVQSGDLPDVDRSGRAGPQELDGLRHLLGNAQALRQVVACAEREQSQRWPVLITRRQVEAVQHLVGRAVSTHRDDEVVSRTGAVAAELRGVALASGQHRIECLAVVLANLREDAVPALAETAGARVWVGDYQSLAQCHRSQAESGYLYNVAETAK